MLDRLDHQIDGGPVDVADEIGQRQHDHEMPLLEWTAVGSRFGRYRRQVELVR